MKKKMILSFLAGVILTVVVIVITTLTPYAKAEENNSSDNTAISTNEVSVQDLISSLRKVRTEIHDPDTLDFFDKLVAGYDLENTANNDETGLPDIKKIQETALTLPLEEAGKQIKDPDINDFYYRFLEQSGLVQTQ